MLHYYTEIKMSLWLIARTVTFVRKMVSMAMILRQERVDCARWVGRESLSQVGELKYFGVLFTSKG